MNKINSLIDNEYFNIINESYDNNNFKFKQLVKCYFFNYNDSNSNDYDIDIDHDNYKISVNWHINFNLNQYGIENINVSIDNIDGVFVIEYYDKQSDQLIRKSNKNINEFKFNIQIENFNLNQSGSCYINDIEIDFKSKIITVNF